MSTLTYRQLGKTGLRVSPLGIGGGTGISSEDLLYAFDQGINYFFFSSDLHHCEYQKSADALRTLCGTGSHVREKVVLATVSYVTRPEKLPGILLDQFAELNMDYIDIFHWGWISDDDDEDMLDLLKQARQLQGDCRITRAIRRIQALRTRREEQAQEINEALLKRGLVRFVGASFHSRTQARKWMRNLDVLMLRYNIAHTGLDEDVVPFLAAQKQANPGIVVFNTGHPALLQSPTPIVPEQRLPSVIDCYRFALSQPWVDLVLTGPASRREIDQALQAVELGPLEAEERQALLRYGLQYRHRFVAH